MKGTSNIGNTCNLPRPVATANPRIPAARTFNCSQEYLRPPMISLGCGAENRLSLSTHPPSVQLIVDFWRDDVSQYSELGSGAALLVTRVFRWLRGRGIDRRGPAAGAAGGRQRI